MAMMRVEEIEPTGDFGVQGKALYGNVKVAEQVVAQTNEGPCEANGCCLAEVFILGFA